MDKEKVIEIKEALKLNEYFAIEYLSKSGESKIFTFTDILTLINDLESENAYKQEHIELWFKKNEEKKARIAELEKEKTEQLKQFAKRLKEKFNDTEYRAKTKRKTISVEELKAQMDWILHEVVIKNIDETLKEFTDGKV